jgi:hypothetical protein
LTDRVFVFFGPHMFSAPKAEADRSTAGAAQPWKGSMKLGVLDTGMVGTAIGKLAALGHDVKMGSRTAKAEAWVKQAGRGASQGTFADAASHGEVVFNCTSGEALAAAGEENLRGKVLTDVANPLDFSRECRSPSSSLVRTRSRPSRWWRFRCSPLRASVRLPAL